MTTLHRVQDLTYRLPDLVFAGLLISLVYVAVVVIAALFWAVASAL